MWWLWLVLCSGSCVVAIVGPGRRLHETRGGLTDVGVLHELHTITDLLTRIQAKEIPQPVCQSPPIVHDCTTLRQAGVMGSGVYHILPFTFPVYCDMATDGGGWTVIQRRLPQVTPVDFSRSWLEYRAGFGEVEGNEEMWLGLEALYQLTHSGPHHYQLRVDMVDFKLGPKYALYQEFRVGPESDGYRLHVANYSGTAGDALTYFHSGRRFSTHDRDQDVTRNRSCAVDKEGGWWFHACYAAHLNGRHPSSPPNRSGNSTEMRWWSSRENVLVLTHVEMKLRRQPQQTNGHHPTLWDTTTTRDDIHDNRIDWDDLNEAEGLTDTNDGVRDNINSLDDTRGEDYVRCEELYGTEDEPAPDVEQLDLYS
ncbi:hypothetical protein Pmani_013670 [Petrolisthes manimaculis]|uniref:Fibrinogen C-terminal domain-containing protein n=1 Tax=Petrolisthes manimaculis TaxID=1843537 RepID=A0AAE1PUP2_9EUCA|nr:hypothetical protein Pmani_013670 [Petrolisthes manimaculis]